MRPVEIVSTPSIPPPFGPSSAYAQTSQARNWRFSHAELARIRASCNAAARARLQTIWAEETGSSCSATIPFLSVEDELALIAYYLVKIGQIVHALKLPELVEATATTFVKRFYLRNTCMDFHPKNIVTTCIFLASKSENYALNLADFARKLAGKQAAENKALVEENTRTVLDLEFLVSQSLAFEYAVTGAHRSLYGLLLDLQSIQIGADMSREELHKLAAEAHAKLAKTRLTDAEFVYTPSQIGLACIRAVEPKGKHIVAAWLDSKQKTASSAALAAKRHRQAVREQESQRVARAKIAFARRTKGLPGAKAVEDQLAAESSATTQEVEFDDSLLHHQPLGMSRDQLEATLDQIEQLIHQREIGGYTGKGTGAQDLERIKQIDARQKLCMNPENVPGSKLFRKRRAQDDDGDADQVSTRRHGKRARGDNAKSIAMDSDDDDNVPEAHALRAKPEPQV